MKRKQTLAPGRKGKVPLNRGKSIAIEEDDEMKESTESISGGASVE